MIHGTGRAIARAFAREGARVFLTGRLRAPLETIAHEISSAGGIGEPAEVDALDESAIDRHLHSVVTQAGRVDSVVRPVEHSPLRLITDLAALRWNGAKG